MKNIVLLLYRTPLLKRLIRCIIIVRLEEVIMYNPDEEIDQAKAWVPDDALNALTAEREFRPAESPAELAKRLFEEGLPMAVLSINHLSQHGRSERIRLEASKYVVERNLGPILPDVLSDKGDNVWDALLANSVFTVNNQTMSTIEAHANTDQ